MTKLFLDDVRDPPDNSWVTVRSFDDFIGWIVLHGVPDLISFDHDLGENQPTGMDCAKWLVENELPIKGWKVHSANPPGHANIESLLSNWKKHTDGVLL